MSPPTPLVKKPFAPQVSVIVPLTNSDVGVIMIAWSR